MRLISAVSIIFGLVVTFGLSGVGPEANTFRPTGTTQDADSRERRTNDERTHRNGAGDLQIRHVRDEQLWTDVLRMHEVIATVPPTTALAVGLKVDVEALPRTLVAALRTGQVDLTEPAVTVELLRLNAVVGVRGAVSRAGRLTSVGITCALCHSSVDNSLTTGIGKRLDGWANPISTSGQSWRFRQRSMSQPSRNSTAGALANTIRVTTRSTERISSR